ncbi:hypothetical protein JW711_04725 [Candidatus Woesearchaeota archaeon]|nr:hypothetical protein [Candidatus Woesearchaeota archaeon]
MRKDALLILLVLGAMLVAGCQQVPQEQNETLLPVEIAQITPTGEVIESPTDGTVEETVVLDNDAAMPENGFVVEATAGDLVTLKPEAVDPDNDVITYYFTPPFSGAGKWQTKEGDEGKYSVMVTASDGKANTTEEVTVIIHKAKQAPVIECPESLTVNEGDLINLNCNIYDPEGEQTIVEFSGFMKEATYQTTFEDAGEYTTLIKARNKYKEASKVIEITVLNKNRAPSVDLESDSVSAMETDIVTLSPQVSDPDGDSVSVTYSEPFNDDGTWKTQIGDAGTHTVSVVATDGKLVEKKEVTVVIKMKNTAPTIKTIADITVYEGETIDLPIDVYDREGDKVKVTVKGWMNSATYRTTYEDAGEYTVTVVANDGQLETSQTFNVVVVDRNRPPVFKVPA